MRIKNWLKLGAVTTIMLAVLMVAACAPKTDPIETPAPQLTLNKTELALVVGATFQLEVEGAGDQKVFFRVKDGSFVTCSESGLITAVGAGSTVVEVIAGELSAACAVTVSVREPEKSRYSITLSEDKVKLFANGVLNITATITDGEAEIEADVLYEMIDDEIAGVSVQNGVLRITAIKGGSTSLVLRYEDAMAAVQVEVLNDVDIVVPGGTTVISTGRAYQKADLLKGVQIIANGNAVSLDQVSIEALDDALLSINADSSVEGLTYGETYISVICMGARQSIPVKIYKGISTVTEFYDISNDNRGLYMLNNDIDFGGAVIRTQFRNSGAAGAEQSFMGVLNGGGYALKNGIINGDSHTDADKRYLGIFGVMEDATVENIAITGITVTKLSTEETVNTRYRGVFGKVVASTLRNIYVESEVNNLSGDASDVAASGFVSFFENSRTGGVAVIENCVVISIRKNTTESDRVGALIGSVNVRSDMPDNKPKVLNTYLVQSGFATGNDYRKKGVMYGGDKLSVLDVTAYPDLAGLQNGIKLLEEGAGSNLAEFILDKLIQEDTEPVANYIVSVGSLTGQNKISTNKEWAITSSLTREEIPVSTVATDYTYTVTGGNDVAEVSPQGLITPKVAGNIEITVTHISSGSYNTVIAEVWHGVGSVADFYKMENSAKANYMLIDDIDFEGAVITTQFRTPAAFEGVLDGCGFSVKNGKITAQSAAATSHLGVFGLVRGTIENIAFINISIEKGDAESTSTSRGVISRLEGGTLRNIFVSSTVSIQSGSANTENSGFVGYVENLSTDKMSVIENCVVVSQNKVMSGSNVNTGARAGAFIGALSVSKGEPIITNCYAVGTDYDYLVRTGTKPGGLNAITTVAALKDEALTGIQQFIKDIVSTLD